MASVGDGPASGTRAIGQWSLPRETAALAAIESEIHDLLVGAAVDGGAAFASQLVVEEIVRNLIEHPACPPDRERTVSVRLIVEPRTVTVQIEDRCPPFAPFDAPPFDVSAPLERRRAGGMGLHLVREMTDELTYTSAGGTNRLTAVITRE